MADVVTPDRIDPKSAVNEKLIRIKSERESQYDDTDDEDSNQQFRPQQFFKDLDDDLNGLPREMYIDELLKCCKNEYANIDEYRQRHAERARGLPDCPLTRLVNRRNSSHTTREKKCASDCYTLNAFLNGEFTRDLIDVFAISQIANDVITIDDESDPRNSINDFLKPDALSMLTQIRREISEISKRQSIDSSILTTLKGDVAQMSITFRTFHGTLNSILSRTPIHPAPAQFTKLQTDVSKLGSSIAIMSKRFLDNAACKDIETTEVVPECQDTPIKSKTYADAVIHDPPQDPPSVNVPLYTAEAIIDIEKRSIGGA